MTNNCSSTTIPCKEPATHAKFVTDGAVEKSISIWGLGCEAVIFKVDANLARRYSEGYSSIASAVNEVTFWISSTLDSSSRFSCHVNAGIGPGPGLWSLHLLSRSSGCHLLSTGSSACLQQAVAVNVREQKLLPTKEWVEFVYRKFTNNSKNEGDDCRIRLNYQLPFFWVM